ncbi:MAG: hypothetical protein LBS29_04640 [Endomicrobium sp.]|jgi:hypothetical protein|nr:hypothetical protein [Endomicrobium sp.]
MTVKEIIKDKYNLRQEEAIKLIEICGIDFIVKYIDTPLEYLIVKEALELESQNW